MVCLNDFLEDILHTTIGATEIGTPTGLPAGVSASWLGNTITISGTPNASGTFNYSIPLSGGCGTVNATGTITVTAPTTPTFTQVGPYNSGASIPALPTPSTNGISGTWFPAISNTATTTYTFTPSAGQCGTTTTMTITINEPLQYTLTANDSSVCAGTTVTLSVNIQSKYPAGTVHCNGTPTEIVDITNPTTGKTWMDRNLGASRAATSSTDLEALGDLYQWGRGADGHQCRNSHTTTTLSTTDVPENSSFILESLQGFGWRSPQNTNLWQGVNGINNPCPNGYRLPTETELNAELLSWSTADSAGAFASPLKLPLPSNRNSHDGSYLPVGSFGSYWSSTVSWNSEAGMGFPRNLMIEILENTSTIIDNYLTYGTSVRCIKN
jgi:uncharacterized protein (TIGR02145 family)